MTKSKSNLTIEDHDVDFIYKKKKTGLNIQFNRVAFIFFIFFIIYIIYSIHLIKLGTLYTKPDKTIIPPVNDKLYRADIVDINGNYLAKTVNSIDIGLKTSEVINQKKLLISLNLIFPDKNFAEINKKMEQKKFFYIEKKISEENYEKLMKIGEKS